MRLKSRVVSRKEYTVDATGFAREGLAHYTGHPNLGALVTPLRVVTHVLRRSAASATVA